MNRRLNTALALMVIIPVTLMAWLGLRSVRHEQERVQARLAAAGVRLLAGYDQSLEDLTARVKQEVLARLAALPPGAGGESMRQLVRASRFIRQPFILQADGTLQDPSPDSPLLTERERHFLARTSRIWTAGEGFRRAPDGTGTARDSGWYTWFLEDGIHFIAWQALPDGSIRGAEVDRYALLAEVMAALPHRRPGGRDGNAGGEAERLVLLDPRGDVLYEWGAYSPAEREAPLAVRTLAAPLSAWQLALYSPPLSAGRLPPAALGLLFSVLAVSLTTLVAAVIILREHGRAMREARQRVSFVNQVSHELKTPLTNIRMYTELLQQKLAGTDHKAEQYAGILVSESRRLGRMITNVLSFGKQSRGTLQVRPTEGVLDDTVRDVMAHFAPAFERKRMRVQFTAGCPDPVRFDRDATEQILGNLLGNAEKYAGDGCDIRIETQRQGAAVTIRVRDSGPGIPAAHRQDVFKPFFRLDEGLTQSAGGTGIGLSIARDLARLHGGDLDLEEHAPGASFRVTLAVGESRPGHGQSGV